MTRSSTRRPTLERRSPSRPENPRCPSCDAPPDLAKVTARAALVFFKCGRCGHVWEMDPQAEGSTKQRR